MQFFCLALAESSRKERFQVLDTVFTYLLPLMRALCLSVGWSWSYPRTVEVPQRGWDAVASVSGKTISESSSRKFQPSHLGRLCWISPEPLCRKLEGRMPSTCAPFLQSDRSNGESGCLALPSGNTAISTMVSVETVLGNQNSHPAVTRSPLTPMCQWSLSRELRIPPPHGNNEAA